MTLVGLKTLFAMLLFAAGTAALLSMLSLMARGERRLTPQTLRVIHRIAGYAFAVFVLVLVVRGARALPHVGDRAALRVVIHIVLAVGIVALLAFKILFARLYRPFLKYAPALGLTLFAFALTVTAITAGFVAVTRGTPAAPRPEAAAGAPADAGSAEVGELLFERHCAGCHPLDGAQGAVGPDLRGLWAREALVSNGAAVTVESVRQQIASPSGSMPAFGSRLDQQEVNELLSYVRTL